MNSWKFLCDFFVFNFKYIGGYDKEEKAARAYDLAALKYWGTTTTTNFPVSFSISCLNITFGHHKFILYTKFIFFKYVFNVLFFHLGIYIKKEEFYNILA